MFPTPVATHRFCPPHIAAGKCPKSRPYPRLIKPEATAHRNALKNPDGWDIRISLTADHRPQSLPRQLQIRQSRSQVILGWLSRYSPKLEE